MAVPSWRWLSESRWIGLAAAVYAEACGGLAYTFAVYSDHLKETLGYSQTQIDALGSSKDFGGNTGVISGLMYNLFPPWVSVFIGGTCNLVGYLALWMTSKQWIAPPYWLVCLSIMVGANGETWVGTAVMVTSMQTFPNDRGVVIGLLKAYIGISGAMFARVYKSFFEPHASAYILMQAVAPFAVSASVMFLIKQYPAARDADVSETARRFRWSYGIVVVLAVYLMLLTVVESVAEVGQAWGSTLTGVMLAVLLLPAAIPFVGGSEYRRLSDGDEEHVSSGGEEPTLALEKFPRVAPPELTLAESLRTIDYWLLFFAVAAGTGSGLTIINNLAQIGRALDTKSISSFVSLVSIWNCAGRLLAGYTSEWCVRAGYPRTLMLVAVIAVMGITQLLLASGASFTLYIGSILVGLSYGAHWTLTPVITSEMFGLKHYGAIYNTVTISSPLAAYFLSTWVAGVLYDREAEAQHAGDPSPAHTCHGPECFRTTLLILAAMCAAGAAAGLVLVSRTRALYKVHTVKPDSEQAKHY